MAAVSETAEAAGVKPGMGWGDARARCPSLLASHPDRGREARAMRTAARIVERYGPWVVRRTDELLVDVAGTAHLFGGERAMLEDCRRVFAERGWSVRAAVASGAGAAWGLARFAGTSLTIGSPDEVRKLPVEALRLDAESAAKLRRVGLRCIGDLASRSRTALAERFGERSLQRLDRLIGKSGSGSEPLGVEPPRPELRAVWEGMELLLDPRVGGSGLRRIAGGIVRPAPPGRSRGAEDGPGARLRRSGGRAAAGRSPREPGTSRRRAVARSLPRARRGFRSRPRSGPPPACGSGGGTLRPRGRVRPGRVVGTSLGPARVSQRGAVSAGRPASAGGGVRDRSGAGPPVSPTSCRGRRSVASRSQGRRGDGGPCSLDSL